MDTLGGLRISWLLVLTSLIMTEGTMLDLTHRLNKNARHWPVFRDFEIINFRNQTRSNGKWGFSNDLALAEHTGTHIDAPAHSWLTGIKLHEIKLENLLAPAVVIDVVAKVKANQDYVLETQDIHDFEKTFGRIPDKAVVFMNTDGHKTYWDRNAYFGSQTPDNQSTLHYPSFDAPVIEWLIDNRNIVGIAVDRASLDSGLNRDARAHQAFTSRGIYGIENVANLHKIPQSGVIVSVMPMNVEGGSGAPIRLVAYWGNHLQIQIPSGAEKPGVLVGCIMVLSILTKLCF